MREQRMYSDARSVNAPAIKRAAEVIINKQLCFADVERNFTDYDKTLTSNNYISSIAEFVLKYETKGHIFLDYTPGAEDIEERAKETYRHYKKAWDTMLANKFKANNKSYDTMMDVIKGRVTLTEKEAIALDDFMDELLPLVADNPCCSQTEEAIYKAKKMLQRQKNKSKVAKLAAAAPTDLSPALRAEFEKFLRKVETQ